ncbi:hypothetical protein MTR67_017385 [Solanum verrucosum]|uniref:CCHC-type domain-containing protein n=1 Tax=Solanum verrucosum TaxID=315347 RepID=A0AAF0QMN7_SOLVR|nr:hypothetical protein MTR67_017385 [Solanum verrucosum]
MVADSRERMSMFVSGASDLVVKECLTIMLVKEIDVSRLIVHAQKIGEENLKEKTRESKRERKDNRNFSHSRSGGGNHSQGNGSSKKMVPELQRCGKGHRSECLADKNACFGCGKMDHMIRNYPSVAKNEGDNSRWAQSFPSSDSIEGVASKSDMFYPLEMREAKAQTMVADSRERMSMFVSGASDLVVKECLTIMLVKEIDVSRLIVHAQKIGEENLKEKTRESKRERKDNRNFSHSRSGGGNHSQGNGSSKKMVPELQRCGKGHRSECLADKNACFGCGKMDHMIRNYPSVAKNEGDNSRWAQSFPSSDSIEGVASKSDMFYPLEMREAKAQTMVADSRERMSMFVSGASDLVVKECLTIMLVKEIDVSRLIVHAQKIGEENLKEKTRESKRERKDNRNFSHSRSGGGNHSQGNGSSKKMVPELQRCGKGHRSECLADKNACFGCGKMDHMIRNYPSVAKNEGDNSRWAQSFPSSDSIEGVASKSDMFYPLEMREAKAQTMVADSRERMSMFVSGASDLVVKECLTIMLVKEIDVSRLIVHAQKIGEENLKEKTRESKRERKDNRNFSHSRSGGGNHSQGNGSSKKMVPELQRCGKGHRSECLADKNACFGCGKMDHMIRNYPSVAKNEGDNSRWAQSFPSSDSIEGVASKSDMFYPLEMREAKAQTMVADSRERMSMFVSGASDLVVKECLTIMLVKEIDVSRLIVHAQKIGEENLKEKTRESKRERKDNRNFSHSRSGGGNHSQGNGSSKKMVPELQRCGKGHRSECLADKNACFGCGKMDHMIRNYPSVAKNEGDNSRWAQSFPSSDSIEGVASKSDMFYPLEMREAKAQTMVADSRERMSMFVSGASDLVVKECLTIMLVKEIDVSRLIVHAQKIGEENLKEKTRESKRERKDNRNFSHSRSGGGNHSQGNGSSKKMVPELQRCGKGHRSECLADKNACFGCGKMDHMIRNYPSVAKNEGDNSRWAQSFPSSDSIEGVASKSDMFYPLEMREAKAQTMVADSRERMSMFVSGASDLVVKECLTIMLVKEIDVSRLIVHAQKIGEENLKEKTRESKRERKDNRNFSHSRSGGGNHSQGNGSSEKMEPEFQSCGNSHRKNRRSFSKIDAEIRAVKEGLDYCVQKCCLPLTIETDSLITKILDWVREVPWIVAMDGLASGRDIFIPLEMREAKVLEFINLCQGNMSVNEYSLKFIQLSKYAQTMVADSRAMMSKFMSGASDLVVKECLTVMLVKEMDVYRLIVHLQKIEEEKLDSSSTKNRRRET